MGANGIVENGTESAIDSPSGRRGDGGFAGPFRATTGRESGAHKDCVMSGFLFGAVFILTGEEDSAYVWSHVDDLERV